jgi:hypothetical protein
MNIVRVNTIAERDAIQIHEAQELVWVEEEKKYYRWDNEWIETPVTVDSDGVRINLYELNKQIVSQLPTMSDEDVRKALVEIANTITKRYYLLYFRELNYFTLFEKDEHVDEHINESLWDCLNEISNDIRSIDRMEKGESWEIWVNYKDNIVVGYLFDYSNGVVYYG